MCKCTEGAAEHEHGSTQILSLSLYPYIDHENIRSLNANGNILNVVREKYSNISATDDNDNQNSFIQSETDAQILVNIPFTGLTKLKSIIVEFPDQSTTPKEMLIYINIPSLDFTSIHEKIPSQTWNLAAIPKQPIEYSTRIAKFSNVSCLSLFFQSASASLIQISYIGLVGEFSMKKVGAVNTNYEVKPVLSDHKTGFTLGVQTKSAF